ncbi:MAG: nucleoside-triphosphatase [Candidatus Saccharicenans sp.]|nr:nucleoside-triphosphatase [Candidatus Saccharicenans sp.]
MVAENLKILITGFPGSGKTTLVEKIIKQLGPREDIGGFITREIREKGIRQGFQLLSLDGQQAILSHVNLKTPHRVGKYRVDLAAFENFLERLNLLSPSIRLVIVDEIGKMECLSAKFRETVLTLLSDSRLFLATVALHGTPFIERVKISSGIKLFEINSLNRNQLADGIMELLKKKL